MTDVEIIKLYEELDRYFGIRRDKEGHAFDCEDGTPCFDWKERMDAERDIRLARHFVEWQKQQMLKDAVEGKLDCDDCGAWVELKKDIVSPGEAGDKVKLIILKEDESK